MPDADMSVHITPPSPYNCTNLYVQCTCICSARPRRDRRDTLPFSVGAAGHDTLQSGSVTPTPLYTVQYIADISANVLNRGMMFGVCHAGCPIITPIHASAYTLPREAAPAVTPTD